MIIDEFVDEIKSQSNEELRRIVINFNMHRGALVAAAKRELTIRGIELTEDEKKKIEEIKNTRRQEAIASKETVKSWNSFNTNWKINVVEDVEAPQLYSRQIIGIFSVLFSILFGGILMAINLKTVNVKKGILPVLIYSIVYTGIIGYVISLLPGSTTLLSVCFNSLGGIVLYNFFWGKYIGKEFKYRAKPFWIPLIIGIIISGFIIWAIIVGQ